jgi:hypothetical protein
LLGVASQRQLGRENLPDLTTLRVALRCNVNSVAPLSPRLSRVRHRRATSRIAMRARPSPHSCSTIPLGDVWRRQFGTQDPSDLAALRGALIRSSLPPWAQRRDRRTTAPSNISDITSAIAVDSRDLNSGIAYDVTSVINT